MVLTGIRAAVQKDERGKEGVMCGTVLWLSVGESVLEYNGLNSSFWGFWCDVIVTPTERDNEEKGSGRILGRLGNG